MTWAKISDCYSVHNIISNPLGISRWLYLIIKGGNWNMQYMCLHNLMDAGTAHKNFELLPGSAPDNTILLQMRCTLLDCKLPALEKNWQTSSIHRISSHYIAKSLLLTSKTTFWQHSLVYVESYISQHTIFLHLWRDCPDWCLQTSLYTKFIKLDMFHPCTVTAKILVPRCILRLDSAVIQAIRKQWS